VGGVSESGASLGTVVSPGAVRGTTSLLVTPEEGGVLVLELSDGSTATLTVPPDAVSEPLITSMSETATGPRWGLELGPAGTWFDQPAMLVVAPGRSMFVRLGALPSGDLYGPVTVARDGSIPVVRLRPFVVADEAIVATVVLPGDDGGYAMPRRGDDPPAVDPLDAMARDTEQAIALGGSGGSSTEDVGDPVGDDAGSADGVAGDDGGSTGAPRGTAAGAAAAYEARCAEPGTVDRVRIVETRRTAGAAAPPKPECVERGISVLAMLEMQMSGEGASLELYETLLGQGLISNRVEETALSLEYETNIQELYSVMASGLIWGFGNAGWAAFSGLGIPGAEAAAEQSKAVADQEVQRALARDRCSLKGFPGGQIGVSLTDAPDGSLKVSVAPAGKWRVDCGEWPVEPVDPIVWELVRAIRGLGPGQPIEFAFPKGSYFTNALSESKATDVQVSRSSNGSVTFSDGSTVYVAALVVNLAESMEELRRRDQEPTTPTTAGT